jgi:hypothetical protein
MSSFFSKFDCGWKKFGDFEINTSSIIAARFLTMNTWEYDDRYRPKDNVGVNCVDIFLNHGHVIKLVAQDYDDFIEWWKGQKEIEGIAE